MDTTSPTLLIRVRDPGNEAAWREFESRYGELILRYCRSRRLQPADAEDVRALVWQSLAQGLRGFEYDPLRGRFRDYLGRVVRSAIARHFSRKGPVNQALDSAVLAGAADEGDAADDRWEREWFNHHFRLAMQTIHATFESKSVQAFEGILMGQTVESVATACGLSVAAVHQAKYRIQKRLRELVTRQIQEEDHPA